MRYFTDLYVTKLSYPSYNILMRYFVDLYITKLSYLSYNILMRYFIDLYIFCMGCKYIMTRLVTWVAYNTYIFSEYTRIYRSNHIHLPSYLSYDNCSCSCLPLYIRSTLTFWVKPCRAGWIVGLYLGRRSSDKDELRLSLPLPMRDVVVDLLTEPRAQKRSDSSLLCKINPKSQSLIEKR